MSIKREVLSFLDYSRPFDKSWNSKTIDRNFKKSSHINREYSRGYSHVKKDIPENSNRPSRGRGHTQVSEESNVKNSRSGNSHKSHRHHRHHRQHTNHKAYRYHTQHTTPKT